MRDRIIALLLILFPLYGYLSWIYVVTFKKDLEYNLLVKKYLNDFFFGMNVNYVIAISILLCLFAFYNFITKVDMKENLFLNFLVIILILLLLAANIWTIL